MGNRVGDWLLDIDVPFIGVDIVPRRMTRAPDLPDLRLRGWRRRSTCRIPHTGVAMPADARPRAILLPEFWTCNARLWPRQTLGQISRWRRPRCSWGAGASLKYIVLAWAAAALSLHQSDRRCGRWRWHCSGRGVCVGEE